MTQIQPLILSNPVFNVKGQGKKMLKATIKLGLACVGHYTIKGYRFDDTKGLVLYWTDVEKEGYQPFPPGMTNGGIAKFLLQNLPTLKIYLEEDADIHWDMPCDDGDVDSELGWRLYTEKWGHIGNEWQACLAIVPSYLWIGK